MDNVKLQAELIHFNRLLNESRFKEAKKLCLRILREVLIGFDKRPFQETILILTELRFSPCLMAIKNMEGTPIFRMQSPTSHLRENEQTAFTFNVANSGWGSSVEQAFVHFLEGVLRQLEKDLDEVWPADTGTSP